MYLILILWLIVLFVVLLFRDWLIAVVSWICLGFAYLWSSLLLCWCLWFEFVVAFPSLDIVLMICFWLCLMASVCWLVVIFNSVVCVFVYYSLRYCLICVFYFGVVCLIAGVFEFCCLYCVDDCRCLFSWC